MRRSHILLSGVLAFASMLAPGAGRAADHADGTPTVLNVSATDASSDITDVFAWTSSDGMKVNLVMDVFPNATATTKFSNVIQYVFHTSAKGSLLQATPDLAVNVICTFDNGSTQNVSCWAVNGTSNKVLEYVNGNASSSSGITSSDGKLKVYAGVRDDPFFFNLSGFKNATRAVARNVGNPLVVSSIDANGCPTLTPFGTSTVLKLLKSNGACQVTDATCGAGVDFFAKAAGGPTDDQPFSGNILGLVVQVDKSLLTSGASTIVGVWASTNKKP